MKIRTAIQNIAMQNPNTLAEQVALNSITYLDAHGQSVYDDLQAVSTQMLCILSEHLFGLLNCDFSDETISEISKSRMVIQSFCENIH